MNQIFSMLARTTDGAMLLGPEGTVIHWNRAAERLLGFKAKDVMGRSCHDVIRGETSSGEPLCAPDCWIRNLVARGSGVRNYDLRTHTKANQTVWLNVSTLPVPTRRKGQFLSLFLFRDKIEQAQMLPAVGQLCAFHEASKERPAVPKPDKGAVGAGPRVSKAAPQAFPLTKREREILGLIAVGKGTKTIANDLCISPATVRNHVNHIFEKLGAHSRLEAVALAFHAPCNTAGPAPSDERPPARVNLATIPGRACPLQP